MKTLVLLLLINTISLISFSQETYVPDDNFEAYLEANGMGNGIPNDDYVATSNISSVNYLNVDWQGISDLTGIQDFLNLDSLTAIGNTLNGANLDLSQNIELVFLDVSNCNSLGSIDVSNNILLEVLRIRECALFDIDLTNNIQLTEFTAQGGNFFSQLNLSNNPLLKIINVTDAVFGCLNVRNGNNTNIEYFYAVANNVTCIEVDDVAYSTANWLGGIDPTASFSEDCNNDCSGFVGIDELDNSEKRNLVKVLNLLGQEVEPEPNKVLVYVYSDGSTEKVFISK